jgi:hypothetical protein
MPHECVTNFIETIRREFPVKVTIPDGLQYEHSFGHLYIKDPGSNNNVWLSLEVAVRNGLVTVEQIKIYPTMFQSQQ